MRRYLCCFVVSLGCRGAPLAVDGGDVDAGAEDSGTNTEAACDYGCVGTVLRISQQNDAGCAVLVLSQRPAGGSVSPWPKGWEATRVGLQTGQCNPDAGVVVEQAAVVAGRVAEDAGFWLVDLQMALNGQRTAVLRCRIQSPAGCGP